MTDQYDNLAQREANTEAFIEEHACILCDPANEWCQPAIEFARWNAADTEGLRGDHERDSARHHAILLTGMHLPNLDQMLDDVPEGISLTYLAELIVDHFETVYSGESAAGYEGDEDEVGRDPNCAVVIVQKPAEVIPNPPACEFSFQPPAPPLFDTIDAMLRSHFGLPPVTHTPPVFPLREQFPGVDFVRVTGYWNTLSRSRFTDHLCAIIPEDAPDGVWEELAARDDVFHLFNDGEAIVGKHYDFTITEATLI